jgi:serine/threonine-protein phosphatase 2A regulatory subunit B
VTDEAGQRRDPQSIHLLDSAAIKVPVFKPMELWVEASPRRIFANAHTYHINSISVNSDQETYLSADDLRINLWHLEVNDQSFNIVDIKVGVDYSNSLCTMDSSLEDGTNV